MHCPVCGQKQVNDETRFCSRCGFPLAGVSYLMVNDGNLPFVQSENISKTDTPRKKGLKRGLMIFLLTFLIVPLVSIITIYVGKEPFVVAIAAILFGVGGLLRMAYALLMESNESTGVSLEETVFNSAKTLKGKNTANALPPQTSIPVSDYAAPAAGHWRDTNDLVPNSVVENTTRQLKKDEKL